MPSLDNYKGLAKSSVSLEVDVGYGKGLKRPKFTKGSPEAKEYMAKIRASRKAKKGGAVMTTGDGILEDIVGAISGGAVLANVPTFRRPIKGSPEARERMAKIRGMRKGKGFLGT